MRDLDVVEVSEAEWAEVEAEVEASKVSMPGGKTRLELMECWGVGKSRANTKIKYRVDKGLFEVGEKWVRNCLGVMARTPAYRPMTKGKKQ